MKTIFEELGVTYTQQGDYLLPELKLPEQEHGDIGVWGQRRRRFLKEKHPVRYCNLLTSGTLCAHLADVEQRAQDLCCQLENDLAAQEGVTEDLKASDMFAWVRKMNSIRNRAEEIVMHEVIYEE